MLGFSASVTARDDAGDLVEIAGAVLESDDVGDLRDLDGRGLGVPGVVAVVDDHRQVGGRGDLTGEGDEPGLGHLDEVGRQQQQAVGAVALRGLGEELGQRDGAARAGVDGHPAGDHLDGGADDVTELLRLEGVEFTCAAGDEDAAGSGLDALGDVAGQQVEVDRAGLGEGRDGEEQNTVELWDASRRAPW